MTSRFALFLLLGLLVLSLGCGGERADADGFTRETGELESSDEALTSGEFSDRYSFNADAGQWIEVAMTASTFDPYVILRPPSCADVQGTCEQQLDNDDFMTGGGAFLWHQADEGGQWSVLATSGQPGESGAYEVAYRVVAAGERPATPGVVLGSGRTERGQLGSGDETLGSGEFMDAHHFVGSAGDRVTVDLRSTDFDPYVILQMPDEEQEENDDWEGATDHARLEAALPADGAYRVLVTTYATGESGDYTLQITPGGGSEQPAGGTGKPPAGAPEASSGGDPFQKD